MLTIYLHIGRAKTGTTSIQQFLGKHRELLINEGINYLAADSGSRGAGHQNFGKSFIETLLPGMVPPREPDIVRKNVLNELHNMETGAALLSSENLEMVDPRQVKRYFEKLPIQFCIKIIYFVRSQCEMAESEYNQVVRFLRETRSFSQYLNEALVGFEFDEVADKWASCFGEKNIICRIYDGANTNVVEQFLGCIFPQNIAASLSKTEIVNKSIGAKSLKLARLLNEIEIENRRAVYRVIFQELSHNDLPVLHFDSQGAADFRARYAKSNRLFTERFLGKSLDDIGGRRYTDQERDSIRTQLTNEIMV